MGTWAFRLLIVFSVLISSAAFAADNDANPPAAPTPTIAQLGQPPIHPVIAVAHPKPEHRFFDRKNAALFGAVFAARTADMLTTWRFRSYGYNEVNLSNAFVDDKPAFAAYSLGAAGLNVGVAYGFHRLGWHKVERLISMVHIGYVTSTAVHNYVLVQTTATAPK